jgi:maleylpyruvate isomerase
MTWVSGGYCLRNAVVAAEPAPAGLAGQIEQVDEATSRLLASLGRLTESDVTRPSLCPGWTVGHVLSHIARNADGLRRSAEGARRGESVPMYDSVQARARGIEAGAARPMTELAADVTTSAAALRDAWSAMRAIDWERQMPHHRYGPRPVSDSLMMRLAEVEIHHVDLAGGFGPDDWPGSFVAHLLPGAEELTARLPGDTRLDVRATDTGGHWAGGPADALVQVAIAGPSWAVAAWLVGRAARVAGALSVTGGDLPPLAPWP